MHGFTGHVDEKILAVRLRSVSISDLQDDCTSFFLDVIEEIIWRIQHIEKEMDRLLFLNTIENREGSGATSNLGDVLSMKLESICIAAESKSVLPPDPRQFISIRSYYLCGPILHVTGKYHVWTCRV